MSNMKALIISSVLVVTWLFSRNSFTCIFHKYKHTRKGRRGNSLAVLWLRLSAFTAKGVGLIPSWGTKIPQAAGHSQKRINNNNKKKKGKRRGIIGREGRDLSHKLFIQLISRVSVFLFRTFSLIIQGIHFCKSQSLDLDSPIFLSHYQ